jgi:hypothetical protein
VICAINAAMRPALFMKQMWKRQPIPADLMVQEHPI